jgi:hypothetical protein
MLTSLCLAWQLVDIMKNMFLNRMAILPTIYMQSACQIVSILLDKAIAGVCAVYMFFWVDFLVLLFG